MPSNRLRLTFVRCEQTEQAYEQQKAARSAWLCNGVCYDTQSTTFALSLAAQATTLIFSLVALAYGHDPPEALSTILVLETVVQVVELAWYTIVALVVYLCEPIVPVQTRYFDWFVTTPTMLISLYFFLVYQGKLEKGSSCVSNRDLSDSKDFEVRLAVIVVFDWMMLALGLVHERSAWRRHKVSDLGVVQQEQRRRWVCGIFPRFAPELYAGFVAFVIAFIPHFIILEEEYSDEGLALMLVTFAVWAVYGIVAIIFDSKTEQGQKSKNSFYNILDVVSKNVFGLVVSIVALSHEGSC